MPDLWPTSRRSDSVIKVDNAKAAAEHLLKSHDYLKTKFPHVDLDTFMAKIEEANKIDSDAEVQQAVTEAVIHQFNKDEWAKVRQRFYKHQSEARHAVKRISINGDVLVELEKYRNEHELDSLSEAIDVLLRKVGH